MKKRYLLLSFMIPVIMVLLIFVCNGIIFDSNSIFFGDAQYQYYQVLFYFKDILSGISNVFYSFQVGFGSSMISTIAYYVLSPFNLLLSLFSYENIEMVNDIIIDNIIFDGKIETDIIDIINSLNIDELNDVVKNIDFSKKSIVILKK